MHLTTTNPAQFGGVLGLQDLTAKFTATCNYFTVSSDFSSDCQIFKTISSFIYIYIVFITVYTSMHPFITLYLFICSHC